VSEKRVTRQVQGRPTPRFERILGKRAESLDCLVYATAAKAGLGLSAAGFNLREDELRAPAPPKPRQTEFPSRWMEEGPEPW
jgi:phage terminase large subunit GpA-like protein